MNPTISIIVPVFNVEDYIVESIKSIVLQDYDNFELIIVDDGSKDNSINLALEVLRESNVLFKLVTQENKGLSCARNTGLFNSRGKYVTFVDSDDILAPSHLSMLYKYMKLYDVEIAYSGFEYVSESNRFGNEIKLPIKAKKFNYPNQLLSNFSSLKMVHCSTLLISKDILIKNNLSFDESLRFGEDRIFIFKLFTLKYAILNIQTKTYKYLKRSNSIMSSANVDQMILLSNELIRLKFNVSNIHHLSVNFYVFRILIGLNNQIYRNNVSYLDSIGDSNRLISKAKPGLTKYVLFVICGLSGLMINMRRSLNDNC